MTGLIPSIIATIKALSSTPKWLQSDDQFNFTVALDIDGVTQIGLRLRARCRPDYSDQDVTFQVEYQFAGLAKPVPVTRIDWRPISAHTNKNVGPVEWRLRQFHASHIHPFHENHIWMIGNGLPLADNVKSNLPIAAPLENDPGDFSALVVLMGQHFNIEGVSAIPAPPWNAPRLF